MPELDEKLVTAVFAQAGLVGWSSVNLVDAARDAGLGLADVRARFPGKTAVLLRFGSLADQAVLAAAPQTGLPREKLFDLLMLRFDQMQRHRAGVLAVLDALRLDPGLALLLGGATLRSMRWLLDAAGVPASGLTGTLRANGLAAVWAYGLRAWIKDESGDLGSVMAAVDRGLDRAVQAEDLLPFRAPADATGAPNAEPPALALPIIPGPAVAGAEGGSAVL